MIVGIDGSNIRAGGGVTHLQHLLEAARPAAHGIDRVIVWGARGLADHLPEREWLDRCHEPRLDGPVAGRLLWQRFRLPRLARARCHVLFAPGGSVPHGFSPVVTMSQNMLPFEPAERARYGASYIGWRLRLLRVGQGRSFRKAEGLIFLSEYARRVIGDAVTGGGRMCVVPHGIEDRFRAAPRPQRVLADCSATDPLRILYVSIVDLYKHQVPVVRAVAKLREEGLPVALDLVGPGYPPALRELRAALAAEDPGGAFLRYHGPVPHADLAPWYHAADLFVFASSCENLPNILIEAMAAGLPIASSDRGPMPEVLGKSGEYLDPEDSGSIARALGRLVHDAELRARYARSAHERARAYSWERCADETLSFLREVGDEARRDPPGPDPAP